MALGAHNMAASNKSLDASGGSVFRIKRDPAKLLGSAVDRSTQPLDSP
jgi:hypothetical protein